MKLSPRLFLVAVAALVPAESSRAQEAAKAPAPLEPTIASGGEVAATTAVEVWLGMVDDGRYPDSWHSAASIFQKAVPLERWVEILKTNRQPLGKLLARKVRSKQFTRTLPGAPDGQYVVLVYDTTYEDRNAAVETVTSVLDVEGQWRVAGYFVH